MISAQSRGVFVISATPFSESGAIDEPSVDSLIEFYLAKGVHGITLLGMMGEAQKLTFDEAAGFVGRVLSRVADRVPVVGGVSNSSLDIMQHLTRRAIDAGAAGVLVAPMPGLHTDEQLYAYVEQVASALGPAVPIVYQDYPQSTGVYLSVSAFARIVDALPSVVMLKAEEAPGLQKIARVRDREAGGARRVSILVGNGGLYYPQALARGADGVMTGFGFPDMLVQVYERFRRGDRNGAEDLYDAFLPLVMYEQQPGYGLAVRKEILRRRGAIRSSKVRAPGPSLTRADHAEIDRLLARVERAVRA